MKEDNKINGRDAADIVRSYSEKELMLSGNRQYSFFISSETAVYDHESYYKVVAGTASKNDYDYYSIEEFGCYLVSLNGKKVFRYDKENDFLLPLDVVQDIVD